jgi:hypothetical protein
MKSLVITSVNPYAKIESQRVCFNAWKALGYEIVSFNSESERKILLDHGFEAENLCLIELSETAVGLFGKQIPRILPLLNRACGLLYDSYILTNSDIFPAHRKPISSFLASLNNCIALTRNECVYLPNNKYTDKSPYRGGLDTFCFSRQGLINIFNKLINEDVSERMTFGIPGWDYFLGHIIIHSGGLIMDGEVLLHESHQTSYGKIDEFQFYVDVMVKSGKYNATGVNEVASEFARNISFHCEANERKSVLLKRLYYSAPILSKSELYDGDVLTVLNEVEKVALRFDLDIKITETLRGFVKSQLKGTSWAAAEAYRRNEMQGLPIIQASLNLLLTQLIIKKILNKLHVSYLYPEGNMHGVALRQIIQNTHGMERMHYLIGLFCSELAEHNVFNKELYKYFVLSADSQRKLSSCASILTTCEKG